MEKSQTSYFIGSSQAKGCALPSNMGGTASLPLIAVALQLMLTSIKMSRKSKDQTLPYMLCLLHSMYVVGV